MKGGYEEVVELLLKRRNNVATQDDAKETALHVDITNFERFYVTLTITEYFLRKVANIVTQDNSKGTTLNLLSIETGKGYWGCFWGNSPTGTEGLYCV